MGIGPWWFILEFLVFAILIVVGLIQWFLIIGRFVGRCIAVGSMRIEIYRLTALFHEDIDNKESAYNYWKRIADFEQTDIRNNATSPGPERASVFATARKKVTEFEESSATNRRTI